MDYKEQISSRFKTESSNLVAILCRFYGIENIQLAEDIISDTFMRAMKTWSLKGVPDKPKAWLRKVAVNKANDVFRRERVFHKKVRPKVESQTSAIEIAEISDRLIQDSQLNMMFTICHPSISIDAQICLALRILCGFSIDEIASALLSSKDAVNKKLQRAKKKLSQQKMEWMTLRNQDYHSRLDNVLRIIYLLFNEGYYSSSPDKDIRYDLCWEAIRLSIFLVQQSQLSHPKTHALIAMMCFNASRLNSRLDAEGQIVLYDDQDKSLWDHELIKKGEQYLAKSSVGQIVSEYHLEAAIAYWHTTDNEEKWDNILRLYNKLLIIRYSPIVAMNRTYALARVNSVKEAIVEAEKLKLDDNHLYHSLLAELYRMDGNRERHIIALQRALLSAKKDKELILLQQKLDSAGRKSDSPQLS